MDKKAQASEMMNMVMTFVIVGAFAIVGVLIFVSVANTSDTIFDDDAITERNESVTITTSAGDQDNSTLLNFDNVVPGSETVANASDKSQVLTQGVEYNLVDSTGNFSLLQPHYNNTELKVTYDHFEDSQAKASVNVVESTVLDSFELGMIALLVLAAVVILGILFRLGN